MHRILGARRSGINVRGRAANRIARGNREKRRNQHARSQLMNHCRSSVWGPERNESPLLHFVHCLLVAVVPVHRILGAIRDRIDVSRRTTNGIARREHEGRADQGDGRDFLDHGTCPLLANGKL